MSVAASSDQTRIGELLAFAESDRRYDDPPDFPDFLRAYYESAHPEHLRARELDELVAIARHHYRLAQQRPPGGVRVDVHVPESAHAPRFTALATVAADMPFLVDTVAMAVRDVGARIDWLLHPVLRLRRDQAGHMLGVEGPAGDISHGDEESLIHIQFDAIDSTTRDTLAERLQRDLDDLRVVVKDWQPMRRRLQSVILELDRVPSGVDAEECAEAQAFLRWLADDYFTFLGYRERRVEGADDSMVNVPGSSLGLLREDRPGLDPDGYLAPAAEVDKYALSPRLLVVTKANTRSWIHHAEYMDVISVKRLDETGNVIGSHRFLGLFSGEAYATSPRRIPVLRRKVREVTARAGLRPRSHAAKSLNYVLETYPRDELFQSSEDELYETAMGIVALRESQRLRLFMRRDRYGRFFSCMVYVPRERYSLGIRQRIGGLLAQMLEGSHRESYAQFLRGGLVRTHFIIATPAGTEIELSAAEIERRLLEATRTWSDDFRAALSELSDSELAAHLGREYAEAFPAAYMDQLPAAEAVEDARFLDSLADADAPAMRLLPGGYNHALRLKLYGRGEATPLAAVLPVLENFGLLVQTQRPFEIRPLRGQPAWVHEFRAEHNHAEDATAHARRVEEGFARAWHGQAENDGLNRLIIGAGLDWRRVALLRAFTRYLLQTQLPYSQSYIEDLLAEHTALVERLVALFHVRFDPALEGDRRQRELELIQAIDHELDAVVSLDADRVLRAYLGLVLAGLRTNYFQTDAEGAPKPYISIKLAPERMPELPRPLPMFETFVYSPEVEGVHLRGGKVARGGLRWSDRREDFRTEVLGLMKAQMVKNAVIVPVGAKGGFVVKNSPPGEDRETRQARGIACYKTFIRGLLDITDNNRGDSVVPSPDVLRHDDDDPYLVVAADKGTASFSDIANGLSREYGFWLDDAFASGGENGYDHKAMGITARGAWEGVKRHFREQGRDIQNQDFTVIGIGDMAGDVFGNGMLLSRHIKLLAAFNHQHIFIDPDPDPEVSFGERQRLFELPRSAWSDYDPAAISPGGGVYSRRDKIIELSEAARAALDIRQPRLAPNELIHELLKAPVDLLWNGGIGTYVKSSLQSNADVGDRSNDALRVNGRELRCKVVGEGGNLGLTQAGRVEFARRGGRLNTDAIDNSGGVDSSDLEVNIKIALNESVAAGRLEFEARNDLLTEMTDSVIDLVLRTNYLQTQLISAIESDAVARLDEHINLMRMLEREGLLDRALEDLPDEDGINERIRNGEGLTRPEIAVLVSYSKISLLSALGESDLPDEPHLESVLLEGFPEAMRRQHAGEIRHHRLRREIISTLVTNQMVDRMGVALAHRLAAERGISKAAVVRAFVLASSLLDAESLWSRVESLDNRVAARPQYRMLKLVAGLVKHTIGWLVVHPEAATPLDEWAARYGAQARRLLADLPERLTGAYRQQWEQERDHLVAEHVPEDLAERLASVQSAGGAMDILELAHDDGDDLTAIASLYFEVGDWLSLPWLQSQIRELGVEGRWHALARASLRDDCYRAHRRITADVLRQTEGDPHARIQAWHESRRAEVDFVRERLTDLQGADSPGFEHLTVAVRDLYRLGA